MSLTVGQFMEILSKIDPNTKVVMKTDAEWDGPNYYSRVYEARTVNVVSINEEGDEAEFMSANSSQEGEEVLEIY